jgi:hypothetical protein
MVTPIDAKILKNARKSITELAELTGLSPNEVAEKRSNLLDSTNSLTDRQEEKLLLIDLAELIDDAKKQLEHAEDVTEYSSMFKSVLTGYRLVADRLDARRKSVDDDINRISSIQARMWGEAIKLAQEKSKFELQRLFPDVDEYIIDAIFEDSLTLAVKEIETNVR